MTRPITFRATAAAPCPVCGSGSKGCSATDNGLHLCRGEPGSGWKRVTAEADSNGFGHYRRDDDRPDGRALTTANAPPQHAPGYWLRQVRRQAGDMTPVRRQELADRLKLPVDALDALPLIGFEGVKGGPIYTFPECDAAGRVVGYLRRFADGKKSQATGAKRGLTLVNGWREREGPVLIVEGASDALALTAAGLCAVGQPAAGTKVDMLAELFAGWPADRPIIVIAENDRKPDGKWPGKDGAERCARALAATLGRPVGVAFPPDGIKDSRAWLTHTVIEGTPWETRGRQFLAGIQASLSLIQPAAGDRPTIRITTEQRKVADEAVAALARDPDIYQRGRSLVRVLARPPVRSKYIDHAAGPEIAPLATATLSERLSAVAHWQREIRGKEGGCWVEAMPPAWCVQAVHSRREWPGIRHLEAVIDHPVIRPDGTVLGKPGFDPVTGLYLVPPDEPIEIPDNPTLAEARAAAAELFDVVTDFPFDQPAHRSAWLAAALTPLARFAFAGPAPLFLIDANVPGAGKGLLCDIVSLIVSGTRFAVAAYHHDSEEMRKCITAAAIAGDRLILLDNVTGRFGNDALDQALTATSWKGRILGESREVMLPLWAVWFATANNAQLAGDMGRRVIHVRLNSPLENPDERADFRRPELRGWVRENRPRLLAAGLTILAAYIRAGRPAQQLSPFGSFEGWCSLVRSAVVWVCQVDPAETRTEIRQMADPRRDAMGCILKNWSLVSDDREGLTAAEFIRLVFAEPEKTHLDEIRDAVDQLVTERTGGKLGYVFRHYSDRVIGGFIITRGARQGGSYRWVVSKAPMASATGGDGEIRGMVSPLKGIGTMSEEREREVGGNHPPDLTISPDRDAEPTGDEVPEWRSAVAALMR